MRGVAAGLVAVAASGCGYRLSGTGTFLPPEIKTIAVAAFENRSARPEIVVRTTEAVARELSRRGVYKVVSERAGADALLEGSVTRFETTPVQFNAQVRATRVEKSPAVIGGHFIRVHLKNGRQMRLHYEFSDDGGVLLLRRGDPYAYRLGPDEAAKVGMTAR